MQDCDLLINSGIIISTSDVEKLKLRKFALLSHCELYLGYSSADRLTCILLICIHNMSNNVIVSDKRNRHAFPSWSSTVCCHFAFPRENCSSVFGGNIVVRTCQQTERGRTRVITVYVGIHLLR